jgi:hypothetical protein
MSSTYEKIATTTLGTTAADVTFSAITGSYTDLVLVLNLKGTVNNYPRVQYNSDTGSNYSRTYLAGTGSAASSGRASNQTYMYFVEAASTGTSGMSLNNIIQVFNYSNTTTFKTAIGRGNSASSGVDAIVNLWRSTSAITSIKIYPDTGSWAADSTFTLYGIKAE